MYKSLFENSPCGVAILESQQSDDPQLILADANRAFLKLAGLTESTVKGMPLSEVLPALDQKRLRHGFTSQHGQKIRTLSSQDVHNPANGLWLRVQGIFEGERLIGIMISDITLDVQQRTSIENLRKEYKMIFLNSQLGIFRYDQNGVILEVNDAFVDILGSDRQSLVGLSMLNLPDNRVRDAVQETLEGRPSSMHGRYTAHTSGKEAEVCCYFSP